MDLLVTYYAVLMISIETLAVGFFFVDSQLRYFRIMAIVRLYPLETWAPRIKVVASKTDEFAIQSTPPGIGSTAIRGDEFDEGIMAS